MADEQAARIEWLREMRDHAHRQLELVEQGWRFQTCIGSQTRNDVTAEIAERARRTIEQTGKLIEEETGAD